VSTKKPSEKEGKSLGMAPALLRAALVHPLGPVRRTSRYYMLLILLSVILAALVIAIATGRHNISFGSLTRDGVAREESATANERAELLKGIRPSKQFLVVVLPDGKVVNTRSTEHFR
jgi:hypothetical protein